jgi:hypothetical protein
MSNYTPEQALLHSIDKASPPAPAKPAPSVEMCSWVIDKFSDEREQVFAVASAILRGLEPMSDDPDPRWNEYRLAEVICGMLGDTGIVTASRKCLGCFEVPK